MGAAVDLLEEKRKHIRKLLLGLAEYFRFQITSRELLNAYVEDLEDLDLNALGVAIKRARRESKFFPLPAVIREYILGSTKDEAQEAAGKIVEAIHKFGWPNPDKARALIGELGWKVVEREGGWENLCKSIQDYSELGMRKAQWRELAGAIARRGGLHSVQNNPQLEGSTQQKIEFDTTSFLRSMPTGEKDE